MTLSEYMTKGGSSRTGPGNVILQESECRVWNWVKLSPVLDVRPVEVIAYKYTYVQKNDSDILWTQDDSGNPKSRSVFSLPLKTT